MAIEFIAPDFISHNNPEDIQERMMKSLPPDIDDMPGGFPYDFTMPTALEKSELIQFHLVRALMIAYPAWAWGEWLDLHGQQANIPRKGANKASGSITVTGLQGTNIPAGFVVCTAAMNDSPSIEFLVNEEAVIPEDGNITLSVTAVNAGKTSNVKAGTVTLMSKPIKGIIGIWNKNDITGGVDAEDDASYRERIMEKYTSGELFNIGNDADYRRWAKEVPGVGDCIVVPASEEAPGVVTLILADKYGKPANEDLQKAVYNHIVSPDDRAKRLMPTGSADLIVKPAEIKSVSYFCNTLTYDRTTSMELIVKEFREKVMEYYQTAKLENIVKYNQIHAILTNIPGVLDFEDFRMIPVVLDKDGFPMENFHLDGGMENILLKQEEYPDIGQILFES